MALDLQAMREKLEASKNGNKKSNDTKWKPEQGDQTIRILPTKDGDPFKEYHFHYIVCFYLLPNQNKLYLLYRYN